MALAFNRPDVDAMLSELTASQMAEWEVFFCLEEQGPLRDDLRAAKIVAAIYNCAFGRTKDTPTIHAEDVFASLATDPLEAQTPDQMRATMGVGRKGRQGKKGA